MKTGRYKLIDYDGFINDGDNTVQHHKLNLMHNSIFKIDKIDIDGWGISNNRAVIKPKHWKYFQFIEKSELDYHDRVFVDDMLWDLEHY